MGLKSIYSKIYTISLFLLLTVILLYFSSGQYFNPSIHFLFLMIIFQSIVFIVFIESPIVKIYFTFCFLFLGCIPYLEHSHLIRSYWGLPSVSDHTILVVNFLIVLINIVFVSAYIIFGKLSFRTLQKFYSKDLIFDLIRQRRDFVRTQDAFFILLLLSLTSTFFVMYLNNFNFYNIFYRDAGLERVSINSSFRLIFNYFIKPIPAIVFMLYIYYKPVNYKYKSVVFFILCLISVFPTGVPRFYAAVIYIPILILTFNGLLVKSRLSYFIIFSVLFIFPFLNSFRSFSNDKEFSFFDGFSFLYHGHFDSYLSIGQVIQADFISYGRQLLGSLFFFVPRSLWENKATGTGHTLTSSMNLPFTNVSANYYAEGYANFGYIGMFLFAVVFGCFLRFIDEKLILKLTLNKGGVSVIPTYFVFLGFIFFIMRGDLLSSISFLIGFLLCIKFCSAFFNEIKYS